MSDISSHFQIEVVTPEVISQNFGDEEMQIMIGGKQAREILILPGELKHCYACCRTYSLVEQQQRPYCSLAVRRYSLAAFAAFDRHGDAHIEPRHRAKEAEAEFSSHRPRWTSSDLHDYIIYETHIVGV